MRHGGRAWRGWFPLGGELDVGRARQKEGLYFGEELGADDPRVRAGLPLHGAEPVPGAPAGLRDAVLEYIDPVTGVGHALLRGDVARRSVSTRLVRPASHGRADRALPHLPLPADARDRRARPAAWSVGEHTDYGLLTSWRRTPRAGSRCAAATAGSTAPPIPDAFVVNLGDMLERMTGGRYRSTPHRVRNLGERDRLSFPLFLDPAWDAEVLPSRAPVRRARSGADDDRARVGRRERARLVGHLRRLPARQGEPRVPGARRRRAPRWARRPGGRAPVGRYLRVRALPVFFSPGQARRERHEVGVGAHYGGSRSQSPSDRRGACLGQEPQHVRQARPRNGQSGQSEREKSAPGRTRHSEAAGPVVDDGSSADELVERLRELHDAFEDNRMSFEDFDAARSELVDRISLLMAAE